MPGPKQKRFKAAYCAQAEKLCSLGADDSDLAAFFGIKPDTLETWKQRHPDFRDAVRQSRDRADRDVERSLYERATGYSHREDKVFANAGKPLVVPTTRHYPPDPTSMMFWLKNRRPARWRDKVDHEVAGRGGGAITIEFIKAPQNRDGRDKDDDDKQS